jgi:uncharacterized protein involved in exopolysaccharide biosynthesis
MDDIQNQGWDSNKHRQAIQDDEINLLDYLQIIYRYRRMIILLCVVAVVTTAIVVLSLPKAYSATASVVPPIEILQKELQLGGGLGTGTSSLLRKAIDVTSIADMYVGILESRAVTDAIIDRFNLMKVYEEDQYRSNARGKLRNNTAFRVSDEGIVTITVKDRDPNRAAAMANAYVDELDRQNKRLSSGQATSKRVFLENRLKEIERQLSNIENIPAREARTKEMLYELLTTECELAKIEEAKSMPTIQVLDRAIEPEMRMPRGTVKKTALAGVVSLMLAIFVAFGREYFARIRATEAERPRGFEFEPGPQDAEDSDLGQLESRRKIIATQRRKLARENQPCSPAPLPQEWGSQGPQSTPRE